jgi:hypothetical protein
MGGLVVRSFCEKEKDFCKESIRKLITIDTPHLGTKMADTLVVYRERPDLFRFDTEGSTLTCGEKLHYFVNGTKGVVGFFKKLDPHPAPKGGAVDNMAVGELPGWLGELRRSLLSSDSETGSNLFSKFAEWLKEIYRKLNALNAPPVPATGRWNNLMRMGDLPMAAHVVVGSGSQSPQHGDMKALWDEVVTPCKFTTKDLFESEVDHDWLVSGQSQRDGLGEAEKDQFHEDHISVLGNDQMMARVFELLEASTSDLRFPK